MCYQCRRPTHQLFFFRSQWRGTNSNGPFSWQDESGDRAGDRKMVTLVDDICVISVGGRRTSFSFSDLNGEERIQTGRFHGRMSPGTERGIAKWSHSSMTYALSVSASDAPAFLL